MSNEAVGYLGMLVLTLLILLRVPVAVALGLVGFFGYCALEGWSKAGLALGGVPMELASAYGLSVVPLFMLMGALATTAGLSRDLFYGANVLFRRTRGALAMAAIAASAAFGAVCGSSVATAATLGRVSIPEMLKARYSHQLAAGAVAAGGTLGILIPPSLILMIYAIIAQQSVSKLFAAALVPGLVLTALYIIVVQVMVRVNPDHAPLSPADATTGSVRSLLKVWHVALLFVVTLGGIYFGYFSPTEAAAIGAIGALLLGLVLRRLDLGQTANAFVETVRTTSALTLIVMASTLFSYFVVQTRIARNIVDLLASSGLDPVIVIVLIVIFYIALGCFLEGIGMVLVTVPILLPVVLANGFDPIWFGVLLVIVVEIGLIHPPVGMNLFVIRAQAPEIDIRAMYLGVIPFLFAPLVLIALLIAYPEIALWLPRQVR